MSAAHIIFGARLRYFDGFASTFAPLVSRKYEEEIKADPEEFFSDLSESVVLKDGYELWQVNNDEDSYVYVVLGYVSIGENEDEESALFTLPSKDQVQAFILWMRKNHINATYGKFLVFQH